MKADDVDVHLRAGVCTECGRDHGDDADRLRRAAIGLTAAAVGTQLIAVCQLESWRMPRAFFVTAWARALGTVAGTALGGIAATTGACAHLGVAACAAACRALEHAFETEVARRTRAGARVN